MKSPLSKVLWVLLVLGSLVGVERLSHFLTDGFSYPNISSNLTDRPKWDMTFAEEDLAELETALGQPYSYLESGSQSYVFLSQDKRYVIKFFKHKRWRMNPLFTNIPLPESLNKKRERWKRKKKETVEATFGSCKTAYTIFRKETGVLYVHLNKSPPFNKTLTVKNRVGFKHQINLRDVEFVVQKKAIPTDTYLLTLKSEGKIEEAKEALKSLVAFTVKRAEKGFSDKDPHLIRNFGFLEGKAVEIDIGGFHRDPKKDLTYFYSHEIQKIYQKLLPWIEENYPELTEFTQNDLLPKAEEPIQ